MNTQEVADRLVKLCRDGNFEMAINELYADNIVSREVPGSPMELTEGKEAVKIKNKEWMESVAEIHSTSLSDPLVGASHFSVVMDIDATYKGHGRMAMNETCVYKVKDGKIAEEQFFYSMEG